MNQETVRDIDSPQQACRWWRRIFKEPASGEGWSYADMDSAELLAETDTEVNKSGLFMQFSDRIEAGFKASQEQLRLRIFTMLLPSGCFVFVMFLATDLLMFPDIFWYSATMKILFNIPMTFVCYFYALRHPDRINQIAVLIGVSIQLQIVSFMFLSESPNVAPLIYALALVCTIANSAYALDLRLALFMSLQTIVLLFVVASFSPTMDMVNARFGVSLGVFFCIYSLIAAYRIERSQRIAYILGLREKLRADALSLANGKLSQQVLIDGLTGVHNRRHFDDSLNILWQEHQQSESSLGLLLIDIDHFKVLNDQHGHLVGDYCLQQVAMVMMEEIRKKSDILARFGGEEFAVLLPRSDLNVSFEVAERLRRRVEQLQVHIAGQDAPVRITVSIGCHATVPVEGKLAQKFVADTDEAMYDAKKSGRNAVSTQVMKQSLAEAELRRRNRLQIVGTTG